MSRMGWYFRNGLRILPVVLPGLFLATGCRNRQSSEIASDPYGYLSMADTLEESLFTNIVNQWYPMNIDSVNGGYVSGFEYDWSRSDRQVKALVQQSRHLWATSFIYEAYPQKKEFLGYASHGFKFLSEVMWDSEYGGFYTYTLEDGTPQQGSLNDKRIYGQAFALYGLSQYYRVCKDPLALELAEKQFNWMELHAHDPEYGGYFEMLSRDGTPVHLIAGSGQGEAAPILAGMKDYNSSIHVMEAITELYRIWPDSMVRKRLEEMFLLIRDTFIHPDGYLQLYFMPDWTLITDERMREAGVYDEYMNEHITYGHDVETAYLLLETAHVLGREEDMRTLQVAKGLVDHSLESGWDKEYGGFFDAGKEENGQIIIVNNHKSWWGLVEGMNALLLMHSLYPDDPNAYYEKFQAAWDQIDSYLIDKQYGGWYNNSLDTFPENSRQPKSHIWKTTYHNTRGMINCIRRLRDLQAG